VPGYAVASELPWDSNGEPLYVKNYKRIYVDQDQVSQEPLIDVLNGPGVVNQTTTVRAYITTDAKNVPSNLNNLINTISSARFVSLAGATQRSTQVTTELDGDAQIVSFEFSWRQLIVNQ
jgi:hypothetical protein